MARKALKLTEKKIADMIQAGRGQGEGAVYQPWIQVGNFSSEGRGHRIADIHTIMVPLSRPLPQNLS
ncbi:hypothetical protein RFF05_15555 [Bengtsoniella intestinalis]|uniref:hypothetical protein n=1 Tax=Bengtsoniella intestinalis TaxID=3073143 RepID=UPI00391FBE8E